MLAHLWSIYKDVNKVPIAKATLHGLYQNKRRFQEFVSNFIYWATEAGLPDSEWKEELYFRLAFDLQDKVMRERLDLLVLFDQFLEACNQYAMCMEQRATAMNCGNQFNNQAGGAATLKASAGQAPVAPNNQPIANRSSSPAPWLWTPKKQHLHNEGCCFHCSEKGHLSLNCPKWQKAAVRFLEPGQDLDKEDEDQSGGGPGNERP